MPWSGGNYTKGNSATGGWSGDQSAGIGIESGRHDTQDNDFATGINQCLNKDGSNAATGNLNAGGFKVTNVAAGTAAAPAICAGNDINTGFYSPGADAIGVATNGVDRIRIDSSGRVGINTNSPSTQLHLGGATQKAIRVDSAISSVFYGAYQNAALISANRDGTSGVVIDTAKAAAEIAVTAAASDGNITFLTTATNNIAPTERMRIDKDGKIAVGVVSASSARFYIRGITSGTTGSTLYLDNSSGTTLFYIRDDGYVITGTAAASPYNATSGSAANVFINTDGGLYRSTSSARYKTDIRDYDRGLADVLALKTKYYKTKTDGDLQFAGLIAEDVHDAGLKEFVVYNNDGEPDALAYSNMVALAFKAIQELNAKVESLEARIAALEA